MFLNQIFAREAKDSRANMLVLRTSYFHGETIRPIVPRLTLKIENRQNPLDRISIVYFLQTHLFTEKIFMGEFYPSGYIPRTGTMGCNRLSADTIESRDEFKPIRN